LSKHHPRITLVFLPTKSPKLNVIEVRWMWLQRKAIDNSTFRNNPISDKQYKNGLRITCYSWEKDK
ncbi:MAG: transposase, partial [Candidatus Nitrosopolaris sp.]